MPKHKKAEEVNNLLLQVECSARIEDMTPQDQARLALEALERTILYLDSQIICRVVTGAWVDANLHNQIEIRKAINLLK